MAFQAALAIALAEFVGAYFSIDRGYWITVTTMALTAQTWGESVKRSFERVLMTILGGCVGTIVYFCLPSVHDVHLILGLTLFFVFISVYLIRINTLISLFSFTCYLVFLFASMRGWNVDLLVTRIMDTAIGALITVVVAACFFSLKTNVSQLFIDFLQKINAHLIMSFDASVSAEARFCGHDLLVAFQQLRKDAQTIRYELLFHRLSQRDFNDLLNQLAICTQFVVHVVDTYPWMRAHLSAEENDVVLMAAQTIEQNLQGIILYLTDAKPSTFLTITRAVDCLQTAIAKEPERFSSLESDALSFFNLIYFLSRFNAGLQDIYHIFLKAY
jgi:uncharacterized membrane protein YgaE (UPF0421/DUF939 family)